jgi:chromosome segregation ATPase
MQEALEECE